MNAKPASLGIFVFCWILLLAAFGVGMGAALRVIPVSVDPNAFWTLFGVVLAMSNLVMQMIFARHLKYFRKTYPRQFLEIAVTTGPNAALQKKFAPKDWGPHVNTFKLMRFAYSSDDLGDPVIRGLQAFIRANFYYLAAALLMFFALTVTLIFTSA